MRQGWIEYFCYRNGLNELVCMWSIVGPPKTGQAGPGRPISHSSPESSLPDRVDRNKSVTNGKSSRNINVLFLYLLILMSVIGNSRVGTVKWVLYNVLACRLEFAVHRLSSTSSTRVHFVDSWQPSNVLMPLPCR